MAFPKFTTELTEIAAAHRSQENEPLLLAIYYDDPKYPNFENMFEVYDGYDGNRVSPDEEILTTAFGTESSGFAVIHDVRLRLVITNPVELNRAVERNWNAILPILDAVRDGKYATVFVGGSKGTELITLMTKGTAVI